MKNIVHSTSKLADGIIFPSMISNFIIFVRYSYSYTQRNSIFFFIIISKEFKNTILEKKETIKNLDITRYS